MFSNYIFFSFDAIYSYYFSKFMYYFCFKTGCPPSFVEQNGRCFRAVPFARAMVNVEDIEVCKSMSWGQTVTLATSHSISDLTFIDNFVVTSDPSRLDNPYVAWKTLETHWMASNKSCLCLEGTQRFIRVNVYSCSSSSLHATFSEQNKDFFSKRLFYSSFMFVNISTDADVS